MADFLEVDNAEVFDGEMEEESINRLKVYSFDNKYLVLVTHSMPKSALLQCSIRKLCIPSIIVLS